MPDESPVGFLERIDDENAKTALREDLRTLGLTGTLALLAQGDAPDQALATEAVEAVMTELVQKAGEGGTLSEMLTRYSGRKGNKGRELARKLIGRTFLELYGLQGHGLVGDDVVRALDFAARSRGDGDARGVARALARFGKAPARVVLGHLEEQIHLVHRLQTEELMPSEIDKPLLEFAPKIFAARLPSMLKSLLPTEPKVRLAVVLWARLRGVALSKDAVAGALEMLVPEKPMSLVTRLLALDRKPLLAVARSADALVIEDVALGDLP